MLSTVMRLGADRIENMITDGIHRDQYTQIVEDNNQQNKTLVGI